MTFLICSCVAFIATHFGVSSTPLRGVLLRVLGDNAYLGVYSLMALITLGAMIYSYSAVPHTDFLWLPSALAFKITKVVVLFAVVLLVMGTMTRNPTAIKMESAINDDLQGTLKITRHPTQWAILLFSVGHLIANGDKASIVFFGTLGLVSFFGTFAMDARKKDPDNEDWQTFYARTSNIPFAALLSGRATIVKGDINFLAIGIGIALYGGIYWLHNMVSGGQSLF